MNITLLTVLLLQSIIATVSPIPGERQEEIKDRRLETSPYTRGLTKLKSDGRTKEQLKKYQSTDEMEKNDNTRPNNNPAN